ncbi:MAG: hypothetical protein JXB25_01350 [Deltaproteobacteria bacterium]|nr:hypothetical protein [Deltaproteobacteria bacterium]
MNDPLELIKRDYDKAEISLAWAIKNEVIHHLFALIVFLPKEFFPEADTPMDKKAVDDEWSVGYQKVTRSAAEGLRFYVALDEGRLINIVDGGKPMEKAVVTPRQETDFHPHLRVAVVGRNNPPYFAGWQVCPRYHEALALDPQKVAFVSAETCASKSAQWLTPRLSFDLMKYPEYWGGAVLVAPNPVFRAVDERLWSDPEDASKESVLLRVYPRQGQSCSGIKVTCSDAELGATLESSFSMGLARLDFGQRVGKVATEIHDRERGILYATASQNFLRTTHLTMAVPDFGVELNIEDKVRNKSRQVKAKSEKRMEMIVGENHELSAQEWEEQRRQRQAEAKKYDQVWFDAGKFSCREQKEEEIERAREYIRSRINRATKVAWIVDPYFCALDFLTFFGAVRDWGVPLRILTSAKFLKSERDTTAASKNKNLFSESWLLQFFLKVLHISFFCRQGNNDKCEGDALRKTLEELKGKLAGKFPTYEIKVMPGEKAAIHDRFIVSDRAVWAIGSSLNEFGSRGSLALRLPDPEPVINAAESVWSQKSTIPFEEWISNHHDKRKTP